MASRVRGGGNCLVKGTCTNSKRGIRSGAVVNELFADPTNQSTPRPSPTNQSTSRPSPTNQSTSRPTNTTKTNQSASKPTNATNTNRQTMNPGQVVTASFANAINFHLDKMNPELLSVLGGKLHDIETEMSDKVFDRVKKLYTALVVNLYGNTSIDAAEERPSATGETRGRAAATRICQAIIKYKDTINEIKRQARKRGHHAEIIGDIKIASLHARLMRFKDEPRPTKPSKSAVTPSKPPSKGQSKPPSKGQSKGQSNPTRERIKTVTVTRIVERNVAANARSHLIQVAPPSRTNLFSRHGALPPIQHPSAEHAMPRTGRRTSEPGFPGYVK